MILASLFAFLTFLAVPPTAVAQPLIPIVAVDVAAPAVYSTTTVAAYAQLVDDANGLKGRMYNTLEHESSGWQNIQSLILNAKGPNGREDSWGICQIHLPSHKEITRAQALDWQWCIDWSADQFRAGQAHQWTEYRLLYGYE